MKNYDIEKVKSQTKFFDDGFVCCFGLIYETEFLDDFFLENLQGVAEFPAVDAAAEFEIERERKIIILFKF